MPWRDNVLTKECVVFCRYLLAMEPDPYVIEKYLLAHHLRHPQGHTHVSKFDEILVRFARTHPLAVRMADAYSSIFYKTSLVRSKLVLLLAILECSPLTFQKIDRPTEFPTHILFGMLMVKGLMFGGILLASMILFLPLRLIFAAESKNVSVE